MDLRRRVDSRNKYQRVASSKLSPETSSVVDFCFTPTSNVTAHFLFQLLACRKVHPRQSRRSNVNSSRTIRVRMCKHKYSNHTTPLHKDSTLASSRVLSHVEGFDDGESRRAQENELFLGQYDDVRRVMFGAWFRAHAHYHAEQRTSFVTFGL